MSTDRTLTCLKLRFLVLYYNMKPNETKDLKREREEKKNRKEKRDREEKESIKY